MKTRLLFIFSLYLLSCSRPHKSPELKVDLALLDAVYDRFSNAYRELNSALVTDLYEENAVYLDPGESILFGRDSFIGSFSDMFARSKQDSLRLDIQFRILDRKVVRADQVIDIGYFRLERKKRTG